MKSLEPRDAFFGGRTGAVALHAVAGCGKTFVEGFWYGCVGGFGLVALELSWLTMEFWIKGPAGTLGKGSCWYWQDTGSEDQQVVERHW